jgi:ribonuclease T1
MKSIKKMKKWSLIVWTIFLLLSFAGCQSTAINNPAGNTSSGISATDQSAHESDTNKVSVNKGQSYSTKDEVAAYIKEYQELPPNFITKAEAQKLGWDNSKGNLWEVTNKMSIGGDRFGNFEGLLPKAQGRQYYECDIDYYGGYRGAERIIYSSDGLVFYTGDHYKTFVQLY